MILRRIVARSMTEALRRVQSEVGPDALIVDTSEADGLTTVFARRPDDPTDRPAEASAHERARMSVGDRMRADLTSKGASPRLVKAVLRAVEGLDASLLQRGSRALPGVVARIVCGLLRTSHKRKQRVALVGPTGVGKTTTIAKLAARDALQNGLATGIVTTDTYRIAAVEQLRAFADMMDLPFRVAFTPQDLRDALREFDDLDRVWIDSSGRSPRDETAVRGIRGLFSGVDVEVLLCLPTAGRRVDLEQSLDTFGSFDPSALVACKWDETDTPGELLSLAIERDLPIAGHGTGQRVPEDWVDGDAITYAQAIVPQDSALADPNDSSLQADSRITTSVAGRIS